jgi:hypothetical protein
MRKKVIVLGTLVIMVIVVAFFELYVFRMKEQDTITVDEILAHPSEWMNRTVIVEGNLSTSSTFDAYFFRSPQSYILTSSDGGGIEVNVSTNMNMSESFGTEFSKGPVPVQVYGRVENTTEVYANGSSPISIFYYYIAADRVIPKAWTLCGCPNTGP